MCVLLVGLAAITTAACEPAPRPPAKTGTAWRQIGSWSGRGSSQTESFGAAGNLRFHWAAKHSAGGRDPAGGALRMTLHSAISGRPLATIADRQGEGKDTAYVSEDPRDFFIVIESADLDWSLQVEEGITGTIR